MFSFSILFHRLGPYHHARLRAVSTVAQKQGDNIVAVEFSAVDNTYAWETVEKQQEFRQVTLFNDVDINKKKSNDIMSRMTTVLDEIKPQVVVIPGWSHIGALAAIKWCITNKIPAILMSASTAHDEPRKWWKEFIKSRIMSMFSSAVVGGTPHVDYVATLGMPRQDIFQSYDVIDNSYFSTEANIARKNSDKLREQFDLPKEYFLALTRFVEKKNLPSLLQAYALYHKRVGDNAWKLVLLGDGPVKLQLLKLIQELKLEKYVLVPGFKQYNELPIYYALAKAFVHVSTTEQWGLVINEAMASGLPVIVSERCGCVPDLVKDGSNGFSFNPYDIEKLSQLMLKISSIEEDEREAMGYKSSEIINCWTPETFAENIMKAIKLSLNKPCPQVKLVDKMLLSILKFTNSLYRNENC